MKKESNVTFGSFMLTFLISLFFRGVWLILAAFFLGMYFWLDLPLFLVWIALGLWVAAALVHALLIVCGNASQDVRMPGGQRTSERLRARAEVQRQKSEGGETNGAGQD